MDNEFSLTHFEWNSINLGPDGLMRVHGFGIPQGATIHDSTFGDITVNKEAGESNELTLSLPQGTIRANYGAGRWRIRTDIKEAIEAAKQAIATVPNPSSQSLPSAREDQFPYPIPGQLEGPLSGLTIRTTVTLLGNAAVLLFCFCLLEEPIIEFAKGFAARHQKAAAVAKVKVSERERDQAYQELEKNVRRVQVETVRKLEELESASRSFSLQFESSLGTSFELIAISPSDTPREIDEAALRDATFLGAWNQMLNAYPTRAKLEQMHLILKNIDNRAKNRILDESDKVQVNKLATAIGDTQKKLQAQHANMEFVRTVIGRERLQSRVNSGERSVP